MTSWRFLVWLQFAVALPPSDDDDDVSASPLSESPLASVTSASSDVTSSRNAVLRALFSRDDASPTPMLTPPLHPDTIRPVTSLPSSVESAETLALEPSYLVIQPTSPDPSPTAGNKKRNTPRRYRQYTDQQLEEALQAVATGLNRSKAARMYGVPETTLRREEVRRQARKKAGLELPKIGGG